MHPEDLAQFQRLIASPIRTEAREQALATWAGYKLSRQRAARDGIGGTGGKQGLWTKGDYVRSLTARVIDLRGARFVDVCLGYADLRGVQFDGARFEHDHLTWSAFKGAQFEAASLRDTGMRDARLIDANLRGADLSGADLTGADLSGADLAHATLRGTCLLGANLERASLVGADVQGARLDGARVYGVGAWDLQGEPASSRDLVVTPDGMPTITADDLRVAQFLYLLVHNPQIRHVLDTVTRKVVLLLGRFTPARKAVLDGLRDALRQRNLVPVLFDFTPGADRDLTETVSLLARMARFVIADLSEPSSLPQELQAIAPGVAVPIRLLIQQGLPPYAMSADLRKFPWVIRPHRYADLPDLLARLDTDVIAVAEAKRREIEALRADGEW